MPPILALVCACTRDGGSSAPVPPQHPERSSAIRILEPRLFETLQTLASDGLGGRYTLHASDITRSAQYLADQFGAAGLRPVGDDFRVAFPIVTGAQLTAAPSLRVHTRGSVHTIAAADFAPVPASPSGAANAELVFVGYAAQSRSGSDTRASYDDLAGLDLRGKIALVLLDAPARPNLRALWDALGVHTASFEAQAGPLRAAGDIAALARLRSQTYARIATILEPYLRGVPPVEPPAGALTDTIDIELLTRAVIAPPPELGGPRFGFGESRLSTKLERLAQAGAVGAIVVRGPRSFVSDDAREADALPGLDRRAPGAPHPIPVVRMRWHAADRAFRIAGQKLSAVQAALDTRLEPRSQPLEVRAELELALAPITTSVPNVIAVLPGGDQTGEIVILGAHYDHIGSDEPGHGSCQANSTGDTDDVICNGADDNASGTAIVTEVARVLAQAGYQPRRTLVFACFAGEEIGLHGSKALANNPPKAPPFSNGRVVAMINIDMVGRLGEQGLYVGGVGSSDAWMPLLDRVAPAGLAALYDRAVTERSDQASFYKHGIPVLFLFTGVHADYHAPGDEAERINREGLAQIADLVLRLAIRLGDGAAIPFTPPRSPEEGLVRALPGDNPATIEKRVGGG